MGPRARLDAAARRAARPVPQVRPAAGAGARPRAARGDPRAPVRGRHRGPAAGGSRAAPGRGVRRRSARARPGLGRPRRAYADVWEVLRRDYLEVPWDPAGRAARGDRAARQPRDRCTSGCGGRSRTTGCGWSPATGSSPRATTCATCPRGSACTPYLEQRLRRLDGGRRLAPVTEALTARLATRGVTVLRRHRRATWWCARAGSSASRPAPGELDADVVVCAVDPRRLPTLAPFVERTMPAIPPVVAHLGLDGRRARPGHELVLHGDPMLVVRTGGTRPRRPRRLDAARPRSAGRGPRSRALARHHVDVRDRRRRPDRPLARAPWSRVGRLAAGRAVAGPRHRAAAARARHPGARACTPPARTPRPAVGLPLSGSRPRSSRSGDRPGRARPLQLAR